MKRRDLERRLNDFGRRFLRNRGSHDVWTNGIVNTTVRRHAEIKEMTAKGILTQAAKNPPAKKYGVNLCAWKSSLMLTHKVVSR